MFLFRGIFYLHCLKYQISLRNSGREAQLSIQKHRKSFKTLSDRFFHWDTKKLIVRQNFRLRNDWYLYVFTMYFCFVGWWYHSAHFVILAKNLKWAHTIFIVIVVFRLFVTRSTSQDLIISFLVEAHCVETEIYFHKNYVVVILLLGNIHSTLS